MFVCTHCTSNHAPPLGRVRSFISLTIRVTHRLYRHHFRARCERETQIVHPGGQRVKRQPIPALAPPASGIRMPFCEQAFDHHPLTRGSSLVIFFSTSYVVMLPRDGNREQIVCYFSQESNPPNLPKLTRWQIGSTVHSEMKGSASRDLADIRRTLFGARSCL